MLKRFIPAWLGTEKEDQLEDGVPGLDNNEKRTRKKSSRRRKASNAEAEVEDKEESSEISDRDHMDELDMIQLSPDQLALIRSSWKVIYANMGYSLSYVGHGHGHGGSEVSVSDTFLKLFEEFPKSQDFFSNFRDTPVDALRSDPKLSKALEEHAVRVMQVVEKVVARLDNPDKSLKYLLNLGKFHRHAGIPSDYFGVMGTIFLHAVRPYLEAAGHWNEPTEDVWMELFSHIARVMTHGHKYYHVTTNTTSKSH